MNGEQNKERNQRERFRVGARRAAQRVDHSYFGRKPHGEIDGGGHFVQKIPARFRLVFGAQQPCWGLRTIGGQCRRRARRGMRARAAMFAAIAIAAVFFGALAVRGAARFARLFHLFFAAIRALSTGKNARRRHRAKGENQQKRKRYSSEKAHLRGELRAKVSGFFVLSKRLEMLGGGGASFKNRAAIFARPRPLAS